MGTLVRGGESNPRDDAIPVEVNTLSRPLSSIGPLSLGIANLLGVKSQIWHSNRVRVSDSWYSASSQPMNRTRCKTRISGRQRMLTGGTVPHGSVRSEQPPIRSPVL